MDGPGLATCWVSCLRDRGSQLRRECGNSSRDGQCLESESSDPDHSLPREPLKGVRGAKRGREGYTETLLSTFGTFTEIARDIK